MSQKDNVFTGTMIKKNGKLVYSNVGHKAVFLKFVESLEEDQELTVFMESNKDDGTNLQLAKIHVYIRKLADEAGNTFEEMKLEIKKRAGLSYAYRQKSFSQCSKEELSLVLEVIKEICEILGIVYD